MPMHMVVKCQRGAPGPPNQKYPDTLTFPDGRSPSKRKEIHEILPGKKRAKNTEAGRTRFLSQQGYHELADEAT